MDDIFNQKEAAEYLSDNGYLIHKTELSRMGKYGAGPRYTRKGHQKLFTKSELDNWLYEQQQEREQPE